MVGEERTAEVLKELSAAHWTVFHDLPWVGRPYAHVDHVVVGPPGLFVIDSLSWDGTITLEDGVLRCDGFDRERHVARARVAALAVRQLVPHLSGDLVQPTLCFVRDEEVAGWTGDVMVASIPTLVLMLLKRPAVLSPDEVRQLCLDLDAGIRHDRPAIPMPSAAPTPLRRRRPWGQLVAAAMLFAVVLVPALREPVTGWVGGVITSVSQSDDQVTEPEKGKKQDRRQVRSDR